MKSLQFCLFLCFLSISLYAGEVQQKLEATYQQSDYFSADFEQTTEVKLLDRTVIEKGSLQFQKPGQFYIHYKGSKERRYISNGKTLWVVHEKEKEVHVVSDMNEALDQESLLFLSGLSDLSKRFVVSEAGQKLTLKPKSKKSPYLKIELVVDENAFIKEAYLFPRSGNIARYRFEKMKLGEKKSANEFVFKDKGYDLN